MHTTESSLNPQEDEQRLGVLPRTKAADSVEVQEKHEAGILDQDTVTLSAQEVEPSIETKTIVLLNEILSLARKVEVLESTRIEQERLAEQNIGNGPSERDYGKDDEIKTEVLGYIKQNFAKLQQLRLKDSGLFIDKIWPIFANGQFDSIRTLEFNHTSVEVKPHQEGMLLIAEMFNKFLECRNGEKVPYLEGKKTGKNFEIRACPAGVITRDRSKFFLNGILLADIPHHDKWFIDSKGIIIKDEKGYHLHAYDGKVTTIMDSKEGADVSGLAESGTYGGFYAVRNVCKKEKFKKDEYTREYYKDGKMICSWKADQGSDPEKVFGQHGVWELLYHKGSKSVAKVYLNGSPIFVDVGCLYRGAVRLAEDSQGVWLQELDTEKESIPGLPYHRSRCKYNLYSPAGAKLKEWATEFTLDMDAFSRPSIVSHPRGLLLVEKSGSLSLDRKVLYDAEYDEYAKHDRGVLVRKGEEWCFFGENPE